jgi:xylulose-5-phosphate/fructose-6-phosphate phosphoketolase
VIIGIGSELTFEVIAAAYLLKKMVPELRVRVINVTNLMILTAESVHPHALKDDSFNSLFGEGVPVHFNHHGYATEPKGLLFGRPNMHRVTIASYMEEGSTTAPFNMMLLNERSRFHVAIKAMEGGAKKNEKVRLKMHELVSELKSDMVEMRKYIVEKKAGT